jgi:hypothetical protein
MATECSIKDLNSAERKLAEEFIEMCIKNDTDLEERGFLNRFRIELTHTGIGGNIRIIDTKTNMNKDITDYGSW